MELAPEARGGIRSEIGARYREARIKLHVLTRNTLQKIALGYVLVLFGIALVAPLVVPYPSAVTGVPELSHVLRGPSIEHPFGTDELGRDLFSRVLYGARISLFAAAAGILLSLLVGVPLGAVAGGFGGYVDMVIMRVTDVFLAFPPIMLAIVIAAFMGPSLRNAVIAIVVSWWPWYTRLVRGQAISMRDRQFVRAARLIGAPRWREVFGHILPNSVGPTIVLASLDFGSVILTLAALSFLGLGAQPPTPEWGLLVNLSRTYFLEAWWYMFFPGIAITLSVLAFNVLGDGIREMLDPKSRTS